jgi:hypothetical protein
MNFIMKLKNKKPLKTVLHTKISSKKVFPTHVYTVTLITKLTSSNVTNLYS